MDEKLNVPYLVYEGEQARNERHIKRLTIALIIAIALMFVTNALWLLAWNQYDYSGTESRTVTIDGGEGAANYIGNDGSIIYGKDNSDDGQNTSPD